ncbi:hypothetical protein glysoja_010095 [Glycine soja]|nr:hypothetical protein glysoja_010095 [Glycine soja]
MEPQSLPPPPTMDDAQDPSSIWDFSYLLDFNLDDQDGICRHDDPISDHVQLLLNTRERERDLNNAVSSILRQTSNNP